MVGGGGGRTGGTEPFGILVPGNFRALDTHLQRMGISDGQGR